MKDKKSVEFPIEITIPAVTLGYVHPKVLLKQTYFPLFGSCGWFSQCSASIPTHAHGRRHLAHEPACRDGRAVPQGPEHHRRTLDLKLEPSVYDKAQPDKVPFLTITARSNFARGESTGKVRILADQLEHGVPIPVTVQNKLTSLVLLPLLGLGLALGYFVRVRQEDRIAKKKLQIEIGGMRDEIEKYIEATRTRNCNPTWRKSSKSIRAIFDSKTEL